MDGSFDVKFVRDPNEDVMVIRRPEPFECRWFIDIVDDLPVAFVGGIGGEGSIFRMERDISVDCRNRNGGDLAALRNREEQEDDNAGYGGSDEPRAEFPHACKKRFRSHGIV